MTKITAGVSVSSISKSDLPPAAFEDLQHGIRIYQGDCLKILAAIPEDSVVLVFAESALFSFERRHYLSRRSHGQRE